MSELPSFFRTNTEKITSQCLKHLEETGLLRSRNKKRYMAMAGDLIDAIAGSIEAMDPAIFKERLYPYLESAEWRASLPGLPNILASVEGTVMELKLDETQARFLWSLFHRARAMTTNVRGGIKKARSAVEATAKEALAALKNEIADRKSMEEELRESERKFRDIAELTPQVIFELTHDGSVSFVNKQGLELFGYTEGDIEKGLSTFALFPEFEHPTLRENMKKIIAGERGTTGYEYTVQKKGGATFQAIIYTTAIFKNGGHSGFRGVLVDITPLKRTEEVLRESEKKFRDLAELMPQVIFEIDTAGMITFANKQAFEIFGYNEQELSAGINAFSLFPAEELPRLMTNLQKITEGGRSPGNEYTVLKKDGSSFPVIIHVARIMQDSRLTGYRGIIIDITEQKRAQQNIEESEKMYRTFFDSTTDFIFLKDEKLHYVLVNKALIEFFGKKEHEILGMTDFALMPLEAASNCHQTDLKALETSAIAVSREAIGEKIYETLKFPVEIAKGKFGIGGFIRDITERTRAEETLQKKTEELDMYFSSTLDLFCVADRDGNFLHLNKAWETTLGYANEDIKGHKLLEYVHPDDIEATLQIISHHSTHMDAATFTNRLRRKDGSYRWIEWSSRTAEERVYSAARDITDRKLSENALMQSEQRLRQIIDLVPHFIFAKDIEGRFIIANKAVADTYGTTVENLIGKKDVNFTPSGEEVEHFRRDDMEVISRSVRKYIPEESITDSIGNVRYLQTVKIPFSFPDKENAAVLGVSVDITESKRAGEALRKSEERLRKYFEVPLVGVTIVAPDGKWLEVNDRFCQMVGYSREELLQMDWQCMTPREDLAEEMGNYNAFLAGKKEIMGTREKRYRKKDGTLIDVILSTHCVRKDDGSPDYFTAVIQDITERTAAQRKIIESEQALRATLAASPIGIGRVRDRVFEWVNEAMQRITGYDLNELVGTSVRFLYETADEFDRIGESLYSDGQCQTRWARKDGKILDILLQVSPTDNNAHIVTASDITELKRNEEILRLNESRTKAMLKLNQMGDRPLKEITDFTLEESVRLTKSTIGYIAFLDEDETELTIQSWSKEAVPGIYAGKALSKFRLDAGHIWGEPVKLRKAAIINDFPADHMSGANHVHIERYLGVPVFDQDRIVAVVGVANKEENYDESDASQVTLMAQGMLRLLKQKSAQEALSISESRLRAIIESARDSIFIKDTDLRYIVANRAMSELFGIPLDEIKGRSDKDIFGAEAGSHIEEIDRKVLQGETVEEEPTKLAGGTMRTFHTIKVPLRNDRGGIVGLCGIARDITDRKHLEAQLMHSQKMEAVGTLAGGVAHDFNNLLSAIMGYASLLQIKMDRGDPLHAYVSQILLSSEKAANLTQSLLAFSRKQVINLKPIALNDTVEKLHRLLQRLIPEDVEFRINSTPERLIVPGDSGQIDQVIMNLVTNARDSMPHGGKLTIGIDRALIDNGFIATHGYGNPGEYALITVSDTGYGMDEKTVEKIFEPFFTTKDVGKGTGLGLAIVYGIVKQHNGYIEVKSQPGQGSTFSIYLPLVWLEPVDEKVHEEIVGGSETILVAEDNNELRALSVNVLEDNGYKVVAAGDGAEAVDAFRLQQSAISLVILDVVMPKMNGKEAFEAIKILDPSVRVIFTSGYTDDIIEEKGMVNEKYDFLGKPITPATLLKKIREVLDRE